MATAGAESANEARLPRNDTAKYRDKNYSGGGVMGIKTFIFYLFAFLTKGSIIDFRSSPYAWQAGSTRLAQNSLSGPFSSTSSAHHIPDQEARILFNMDTVRALDEASSRSFAAEACSAASEWYSQELPRSGRWIYIRSYVLRWCVITEPVFPLDLY